MGAFTPSADASERKVQRGFNREISEKHNQRGGAEYSKGGDWRLQGGSGDIQISTGL